MRPFFLAAGLSLVVGTLGAPAARAADLPPPAPVPGLTPTCLAFDARLGLFGFRLGFDADRYLERQRLYDWERREQFRLRDRELRERFGVYDHFDTFHHFRDFDRCGRGGYPAPRYGFPSPSYRR